MSDFGFSLSLAAGRPGSVPDGYETEAEFLQPLMLIHQSLYDTGAGMVADGRLTDLIRRVHAFGLALMKLDIRQARALSEARSGCSNR